MECARTLQRIGKASIPALMRVAKSPKAQGREYAMLALGSMGADAKRAIPLLVESLKNKDLHSRGFAAVALGMMGEHAKQARSALQDWFKPIQQCIYYLVPPEQKRWVDDNVLFAWALTQIPE
jgi:hypothetical protein